MSDHFGFSYRGNLSVSESGSSCLPWKDLFNVTLLSNPQGKDFQTYHEIFWNKTSDKDKINIIACGSGEIHNFQFHHFVLFLLGKYILQNFNDSNDIFLIKNSSFSSRITAAIPV